LGGVENVDSVILPSPLINQSVRKIGGMQRLGRLGYSFRQTLHLASPKMKFYDLHLNNAVWYARHAMSIDESRASIRR